MTILDAYALVAALTEDPTAEIKGLFTIAASPARVTTINLAEVFDVTVRVMRRPSRDVSDRIQELTRIGRLNVVPVDEAIGVRAGLLRAVHYDKRRRDVSLADCVATATAEVLNEPLATPDRHLAALAREIGLNVIPLPDSSGRRP